MIPRLLDFSPFDLASAGAFLVLYALFAAVGLAALAWLRARLGHRLDEAAARAETRRAAAAPGRAAGMTPHRRLAIGWIPQHGELPAIAWLREGSAGVANLLIATALADGWLGADAAGRGPPFFVVGAPNTDEPLQGRLHALLSRPSTDPIEPGVVKAAAREAASHSSIEVDLAAAGFLRTGGTHLRLAVALMGAGLPILAVGALRALRIMTLGGPIGLLALELAAAGVAVGCIAFRRRRDTDAARAYLAWLADATVALQADVAVGRRHEPDAVALAAAVGGFRLITSTPLLAPLSSAFFSLPVAAPADAAPSINSSVAPSSCGGGGSCGGGDCGGGHGA